MFKFTHMKCGRADKGNQPEFKISYINPVNDSWVIGTGMYLPEIPVNFSSDNRDMMVSKVHEAATYVEEHGKENAIRNCYYSGVCQT